MGFLSNLIKSSLSSKCPKGYKMGGVTKDGIIYYDKIVTPNEPQKLSTVDKEKIMVQQVTIEDMKCLVGFSYDFNCPLEKFIKDGTHPYAYIRLNSFNQSIAKRDLDLLSTMIRAYPGYSSRFPFDVSKIEYSEYSPSYGYTKLICTPKTPTGKTAKYPLSLSFMSQMDVHNYQCLGTIKYLGLV